MELADNYDDPVDDVKLYELAYINELTFLEHAAATDCKLYVANERFYTAHFAFATRPNFPYVREFSEK